MKYIDIAIVCLALYLSALVAALLWPVLYFVVGKEPVRAATQAVNAMLGGYARESLSSRMERTGDFGPIKRWVNRHIALHTYEAAMNEARIVVELERPATKE